MERPEYKRSWVLREFQAIWPNETGMRCLDIGCGAHPLPVRSMDELVTMDFDPASNPDIVCDLTVNWPFGEQEFDLVYAGHVMEHFYPADRDTIVRRVHASLRGGGYFFFRVPHRSSMQAVGWEHHTYYGTNSAVSLCHGRNPRLPWFRAVAFGASMIPTDGFSEKRSIGTRLMDGLLNKSFRATEFFRFPVNEVQFLLQRLPVGDESRLREMCGSDAQPRGVRS